MFDTPPDRRYRFMSHCNASLAIIRRESDRREVTLRGDEAYQLLDRLELTGPNYSEDDVFASYFDSID